MFVFWHEHQLWYLHTTGKITTRKKGTFVWPGGFKLQPEKIMTRKKKRYSRLADGWNKSQITVCPVKIQTPYFNHWSDDCTFFWVVIKRYSRPDDCTFFFLVIIFLGRNWCSDFIWHEHHLWYLHTTGKNYYYQKKKVQSSGRPCFSAGSNYNRIFFYDPKKKGTIVWRTIEINLR